MLNEAIKVGPDSVGALTRERRDAQNHMKTPQKGNGLQVESRKPYFVLVTVSLYCQLDQLQKHLRSTPLAT